MKRLVVSHYNEHLDWIRLLNPSDIDSCLIYNKNHDKNLDTYLDYLVEDDQNIYLANIGREAHTYLIHIVKNYNKLYDFEIFCQGNPFEHCMNFFDQIYQIEDNLSFKQIGQLESIISKDNIKKYVSDFNFNYLNNLVKKDPSWTRSNFFNIDSVHLDLFGQEMPETSVMKPYAQFIASKECIRSHSLETYERLLEYFNDNINYNVMAWHMEYFWHILFRESIHLKYDKKYNIFNFNNE
jgi:hypothetical protein